MTTDYLTPDEVASHLQVSRQVVYNWINDGRLRAVKAGRTLRIPQYALDAFLQPVHAGDIGTDDIVPEGALGADRFTPAAQAAAQAVQSEVLKRQHIQGEVEHLLWALLQQPEGILQQVLHRLGIDRGQVEQQLDQALAKLPTDSTLQPSAPVLAISARVRSILQRAEELASQRPDLQIDTNHILMAICEEADGVSAQILHSFGVTAERLQLALIQIKATQPAATPHSADWEHRIEQQLSRIEAELAAIRAKLSQPGNSDAV